ncbi:MAG: PRC-barrel domain-containing protein [Verrucomicrobiota bacterium]|nr:PRC-barrel domain-containing protein [Verrucomicrobiota bacterium]
MKRQLIQTAACCAALALSATVMAADNNQKSSSHPQGKLVKASQVTGAKLFDQNGKNIGELDDVLFDENTGGMTHAIVSVGGWLGIGEKESAVPWKFVRPSKDKDTEFVLTVDQSKLKDSDNFDRNHGPTMDESWYQKNYQHYGLTAGKNVKLVRASKAVGADVYNTGGDKIGEIKDLLMHPTTGKVAYGTLSIGEYVGKGDKLTNVPWNAIRQSKKETAGFVVNVDKAKLAAATYFDKSSWPDENDWGWQTNNYGYYGFAPYWTDPTIH